MLVICNGNPKAGTHALVKTVELLGIPWDHTGQCRLGHCILGHWSTSNPPPQVTAYLVKKELDETAKPDFKHIHIVRNPRNMLVSWVRFSTGECSPGRLISAFKNYVLNKPIYDEFVAYVGWLDFPGVLTVRFEELTGDKGETAQKIADFLGVPVLPDTVERRLGGTVTWTGKLSHWPDYWSDEIEAAWVEARGPEIEEMFGYG